MVHLNGNLLAAIDFETTGRRAGYHEIVQMAIVPLNSDLRPLEAVQPFYIPAIKPLHTERAERGAMRVNGLNLDQLVLEGIHPDRVQDLLVEWFEKLDLPFKKVLVPLVANWAFESAFLKEWLGVEMTDSMFHSHARDVMLNAVNLNDKAATLGLKVPFSYVGMESLSRFFGVVNQAAHNALGDALAEAEVYRAMLRFDLI